MPKRMRRSKPPASPSSSKESKKQRYGLLKSCDIVERTVLKSPNLTALALVRVGDTLDIEFRPGPPALLVAMTSAGTAAGAIDCPSSPQIVECIQLGVRYVAKVLSLRERFCRVRV